MKKIIRLFASVGLTLSITSNLVACGDKPEIKQEIYVPQLLPASFEWSLSEKGPITKEGIRDEMNRYLNSTGDSGNYQLAFKEEINSKSPRHQNDILVMLEFNNNPSPFYIEYSIIGYPVKNFESFNFTNNIKVRDSMIKVVWQLDNVNLDTLPSFKLTEDHNFKNNKDYQNFIFNEFIQLFLNYYYKLDISKFDLSSIKSNNYNFIFVDKLTNKLFYSNDYNNSITYNEYGNEFQLLAIQSNPNESRFTDYLNLSLKVDLLEDYKYDITNLQSEIIFPEIKILDYSAASAAEYGNLEEQKYVYEQISSKIGINLIAQNYFKEIHFYYNENRIPSITFFFENMEKGAIEDLNMIFYFNDNQKIDYWIKGSLSTNIKLFKNY